MDVWKREILNTIYSHGGTATYREIYDNLRDFEQSRNKTKWGRRQIKLHIKQLLEFRDIDETSGQTYSLTPQGRDRILKGNYSWKYSKRDIIEL